MLRTTLTALAFALPLLLLAAPAVAADDAEAKATAEKLLTAGEKLFIAKDAKGLAATYTDDAVITSLSRDNNSRAIKTQTYIGRETIEKTYVDLFKGDATLHAKNTIKHVYRIAPDVLAIAGEFTPDTQASDPAKVPFVQVRVKQGDAWKIASMQLLLLLDK
jgi:ketosteroid isomerase-like protein